MTHRYWSTERQEWIYHSPEDEDLARKFHELYEELAPEYGYETRQDTREFDPTSPNGRLMIAVCGRLLREWNRPHGGQHG